MKQWLTPWGDYYVGDKLHSCDIEVTERPPLTSEQEAGVASEELARIDAGSVRPLRAVMVAMIEGRAPNAGDEKRLVEIEKRAVAERAKVKKGE